MAMTGVYQFTNAVQLKILALLWKDEKSYSLYRELIKPSYFTKDIRIDLCRMIFDYREKYGVAPTLDALTQEVELYCGRTKTKQKLLPDYISDVNQMADMGFTEIEYLKDKITEFGRHQAMHDALVKASDILRLKNSDSYTEVEKLVRSALLVGTETSDLGSNAFRNIDERINVYCTDSDVIERIPTEITKLDEILGGGLGRTEMGVIVAPPGTGKTSTLTSIGGAAVKQGYKVLHISLENNIAQTMRNYDTRLLERDIDYIKAHPAECASALKNIEKYHPGCGLIVKKYPTKSITVNTIRALLDQIKLVYNFCPDVLIVDYGALLKPTENYTDKRNSIEGVYEALRALADEYNLALWTAAQGNRSSLGKKVVTMSDLAECFAIGNTADVMACLCQTRQEKDAGVMRLFLAKVRDSADGQILKGSINHGIKKLTFDEIAEVEYDSDDDEDEDWDSNKKKK